MSHLPTADDWRPTASIENLHRRAMILRRIREFFDGLGFFEVQTPCLSNETVVDLHLDPVRLDPESLRGNPRAIAATGLPESGRWMFLQTSPEAAMKRLLAAGATAIYQIGPVFRSDERGPLHNPEFTMLEWYRVGDSMSDGIDCLRDLVTCVLGGPVPQVISYEALFQQTLGFSPLDISRDELLQRLESLETGYAASPTDSRDTWLDVLMGTAVAPRLSGRTIVSNYPLSQGALARRSDVDPRTAERFEMFIDGVELANGYAELLDAEILSERTEQSNRLREADGRAPLPAPHRLLRAMRSGIPQCSGTAVGVDRLVMAAIGAERIEQVIPFPVERA